MKATQLIACTFLLLLASCGSKQTRPGKPSEVETTADIPIDVVEEVVEKPNLPDFAPLIFSVQLGIHPSQKNWVLYKNGSYMLFKDPLGEDILTEAANKRLKALTSPSGITVKKSAMAKGWVVQFGSSGIYNYVTTKQMEAGVPEQQMIINQAKRNLAADQKATKVIKVNQE